MTEHFAQQAIAVSDKRDNSDLVATLDRVTKGMELTAQITYVCWIVGFGLLLAVGFSSLIA